MDYLAKAAIELVALFKQLFVVWVNGGGNMPAAEQGMVGDSISSIFANGVNFFAELAAEITRQMANIAQ